MTMHPLPPRRRVIGYLFPALIVLLAVFMFPPFISAGRGWWPVFILAPAAVLAVLVAVEWRKVAVGFDGRGVAYQAVGYRLNVPWDRVKLAGTPDRPSLVAAQAEQVASPWFAILLRIGAVLTPGRTAHAVRMASNIPLYYFAASGEDAVMRDFRQMAPAELRGERR